MNQDSLVTVQDHGTGVGQMKGLNDIESAIQHHETVIPKQEMEYPVSLPCVILNTAEKDYAVGKTISSYCLYPGNQKGRKEKASLFSL